MVTYSTLDKLFSGALMSGALALISSVVAGPIWP